MPVIPAAQRKEDLEFKVILGYIVSETNYKEKDQGCGSSGRALAKQAPWVQSTVIKRRNSAEGKLCAEMCELLECSLVRQ
jgi:hypothetical protein